MSPARSAAGAQAAAGSGACSAAARTLPCHVADPCRQDGMQVRLHRHAAWCAPLPLQRRRAAPAASRVFCNLMQHCNPSFCSHELHVDLAGKLPSDIRWQRPRGTGSCHHMHRQARSPSACFILRIDIAAQRRNAVVSIAAQPPLPACRLLPQERAQGGMLLCGHRGPAEGVWPRSGKHSTTHWHQ